MWFLALKFPYALLFSCEYTIIGDFFRSKPSFFLDSFLTIKINCWIKQKIKDEPICFSCKTHKSLRISAVLIYINNRSHHYGFDSIWVRYRLLSWNFRLSPLICQYDSRFSPPPLFAITRLRRFSRFSVFKRSYKLILLARWNAKVC